MKGGVKGGWLWLGEYLGLLGLGLGLTLGLTLIGLLGIGLGLTPIGLLDLAINIFERFIFLFLLKN